MYIDALGDEAATGRSSPNIRDDLEAKAFEVWRICGTRTKDRASAESNWAMPSTWPSNILRVDPMHPIHHAVIHIADVPTSPEPGPRFRRQMRRDVHRRSATCGTCRRTFISPLERYPEAAWQLEASIRTEHARMMHDRVLPDQVHLYAHNNEWLVRMLLFLGRVREARRSPCR